jgi:hypothetical protein
MNVQLEQKINCRVFLFQQTFENKLSADSSNYGNSRQFKFGKYVESRGVPTHVADSKQSSTRVSPSDS